MPEFVLPEFARSLRALALPTSVSPEDEAAFQPLLQARQLAQKAQSMDAQIAAFDAPRLERAWRAHLETVATARQPRSAPERRALTAQLDHLAAPLWAALAATATAGGHARAQRGEARRPAWEAWVRSVHALFHAADDWWFDARALLAADERRRADLALRRPLWRRVLGVGR